VPELHYRWEWHLASSPDALWPLVADTNRFNRDAGGPRVEPLEVEPGGRGARRVRLRAGGRSIRFEESPFQWVRPERFGVVRRYENGPLAETRWLLELASRDGGGSSLVYQVWVRPRGLVGRLAAAILIGRVFRRRFERTFRRCDERSAVSGDPPARPARPRLAPGGRERLERLTAELASAGAHPQLVARLARLVEGGDELDLARLRPYRLAEQWGAGRRQALELFLLATRLGLLESRWEVLCPLCRGAAATSEGLSGVFHDARCESCDAAFAPSFDRQVELTFRPSAAVRDVPHVDYCTGGPGLTPHVVLQQLLDPGERRPLSVALEPGAYRIRARGVRGAPALVAAPGGAERAELELRDEGWLAAPDRVGTHVELVLVNAGQTARAVALERTAWADDAATAADVTALQAFRDLFGTEALRPGEELSIGSLTIVFTDLRDSTRLYRAIGDAPAFGSVSTHFDLLRTEIAEAGGAVVKTIGDAVMAVFRRPVPALRAMLASQRRLAAGEAGRPLALKAGVHSGPCIAVTLNDRLDYFGSTVNAAARIVGLSSGEDVVLSDAVRSDPEVADLVAGAALELEPVEAVLKGFDDERLGLWRVRARA
jgi:class 3 adenylate cyclase